MNPSGSQLTTRPSTVAWLRLALVGVLAAHVNARPSSENSWPHLRGPQLNGHTVAEVPVLPWSKTPPTILWKRVLGQGYSGLVGDGKSAFTQTQDTSGCAVICVDIRTGATLWQTVYAPPLDLDDPYPGPFSTPTLADGRVFFAGRYGALGCLDAVNGRRRWQRDLVRDFGAELTAFGYASSPLVLGSRVYLPAGGRNAALVALDTVTGKTIWTTGNDAPSYTSVLPIQMCGKTQLVAFLHSALVSFAPESGRELWRDSWPAGDEHAAWPVYAPPYLFCATPDDRGARVLRLDAEHDRRAPVRVWQRGDLTNDICSSVVVEGYIYGFHNSHPQADENGRTPGTFTCVDIRTGSTTWATESTGHTHVLAAGKTLIMLNENGILILAEADPRQYVELARMAVLPGELCWTQPSLCGPYLLVRSRSHVACVVLAPPSGSPAEHATHQPLLHQREARPHRSRSWTPSGSDLLRDYVWGILAAGVALLAAAKASPHPLSRGWTAVGACTAVVLLQVITYRALDRGIPFLWPFPLYMAYLATATAIQSSSSRQARIWTAAFVGSCLAFWVLAQVAEIAYGVGFLVGLLPGWPLAALYAKRASRKPDKATFLSGILGITLCYWTSVAAILWRMGG